MMMMINDCSPQTFLLILFHTRLPSYSSWSSLCSITFYFSCTHILYSSPNTRINSIELSDHIEDDYDWEVECEEKWDLSEGVGSPHMGVEETLDTQTLGWEVY